VDFPSSQLALVKEQLALMGRIGATRIYVTPPVPNVAAATTSNQPSNVRFNEPGWILAMYGVETLQATFASQATFALRVQINGDQDFVINGNGGPGYASFLGLFGGVVNWIPIMRRVVQGDLWTFTYQNNDPVNASNGQIQLACLMDADVERMQQLNEAIRAGG